MQDENGTEATRSDAPSAHDALFGDAAEEPDAAIAEDADSKEHEARDANRKAEQDPQEPEAGEEKADDAETGAQTDLKVVVSIKGNRATIGVKGTSSDPYIESFDDPELSGLAQRISDVLERARARWEDSPKYPAYSRPASSTGRRTRRNQGSAQATTEHEAESQQQELRLF